MSRIWAVARHMIAESVRTKVALLFVAIIVILLTVTPFVVAGDGLTLKSRVQSFLAYSLSAVGFLLSMLTVFLSCGSLAGEIRQKHITMIVSKPIPRWQFFVGKWLGICVLNAGLLVVTAITVLGFTWYLARQPTTVPGDREALNHELLTVRHGFRLEEPDWDLLVEDRIRLLREQNRWEDVGPDAENARRRQIRDELKRQWRRLAPGEIKEFKFSNLLVDRKEGYVHLHFKPTHPTGASDVQFKAWWVSGDRRDLNTLTRENEGDFIVDRFHTIPIPTYAVNADDTLYVMLGNRDVRDTIVFEGADSLELLYGIGTFHWNLVRALTIIWCRLAFLAVMGLLASTFLSFPVACMSCFLVLAVASSAGWLSEAIKWVGPDSARGDPLWVLGPVLRPLAQGFVWLVPDFSKFDAVANVVGGRLVPLMWVLQSLAVLILLKGLVLGVVGCVVLTKRELAEVVA